MLIEKGCIYTARNKEFPGLYFTFVIIESMKTKDGDLVHVGAKKKPCGGYVVGPRSLCWFDSSGKEFATHSTEIDANEPYQLDGKSKAKIPEFCEDLDQ